MLTRARHFGAFLIAMLALAIPGGNAWAVNYYVRATGVDTNDGKSAATAFKTVQKAMSVAAAGDVIYIGKGTFTGAVTSVRAGTATNKIRLFGDTTGAYTGDKGTPTLNTTSGATVTITHDNIEFQAINITGTVSPVVWSGAGGALRSLNVSKGSSGTIRLSAGSLLLASVKVLNGTSDALTVTGGTLTLNTCTVYKNAGRGVVVNGAAASAVLDRNTFYTNTGYTVELLAGSLTMTNNLVRNTTNGVRVAAGTAQIWNNTFFAAGSNGLLQAGGTVTAQNNIFTQVTNALVYTAGTLTHNNNLYWNNTVNYTGTVAATKDVASDPKFISASNWGLQTSSPAIDMGATTTLTALDRTGAARPRGPAYDIGAYEVTGPSKTVPYFTDFEATGTPGTEWTSTAVLTSTQSTRFAGPFANATLGLRLTTTPGTDYTLIFDVYFLATWDGDSTTYGPDYFGVGVDGEVMLRSTYAYPGYAFPWSWPDQPETWRGAFTGITNQVGVMRSVVVDFTAENAVTFVTFFGENLQGWSDEGWGIDNVRVVTAANAAAYRPAYEESGRLSGFDQVVSSGEAAGLFWGDFDADGRQDAIQGGGATSRLSLNTGGSFLTSTFTNVVRQGAIADFNNDGTLDFWGIGPSDALTLFLNSGSAAFTSNPMTSKRISNNEGLAAADMNGDGYCDLAVFAGSGNFAYMADPSLAADPTALVAGSKAPAMIGWSLSNTVFPTSALDAGNGNFCSSADVNNDGYPDFFYHYSTGRLFLSNGDGTYTSNSRGIKVVTGESDKAGSVWGDFDNDGNVDLFVASRNSAAVSLWKNPGGTANFTDVASARGIAPGAGVLGCDFGDYDNDGNLDLYLTLTTGQAILYRNQGPPSYDFVAQPLSGVAVETRGGDVSFIDVDNDGNLDLALTSENSAYPSLLYENQNANPNFLLVRVLGRGPGGINKAAVGTRVELWDSSNKKFIARRDIGAAKGYGGQSELIAHFGGVKTTSAYTLRIISGSKSYAVSGIVPGSVTTTISAEVIPQMYTFDESKYVQGVKIVRWREQGPDE